VVREAGEIDASRLKGSWAGAFGHTQFMPSTYQRLAVDGDGDGRRDVVDSVPDAVASTANFLRKAGWSSGVPWGYGPGWAWYRFLGHNRPDPESFEASQDALGAFLSEIRAFLPVKTGTLVLGGFSQGGAMSMAYALRNPGTAPLVMNFSGFLADHPTVRPSAETVAGTRFWWGHGTMDPQIPFDLAIEGRGLLQAAGAELETHDYPIGHAISPDEARDARAWIQAEVARRG